MVSSVDFLVAHPFFLAQDELLDLTGRDLGKLTEFDGHGGLEAGDALLAEFYDLLFGGFFPLLQGNESLRTLPPFLVRDGDHGSLHYGRMPANDLLDLNRGDVLAAGDDHVLAAVPELDAPIRMPDGDVARVVPSALERRFGGHLVVQVALHNHVAAHDDLAHRLPVERHVVHLIVHDSHQIRGKVALTLPS